MINYRNILLFLISVLGFFVSLNGQRFPQDSGVIDVTQEPWNLDNTGVEDCRATFQQLIDETIPRKFVDSPDRYWPVTLYFPNGTYRFSGGVVGANLDNGRGLGGLVIIGESRDGTILKLDDNAVGFDDPNAHEVFINYFDGNGTNNAFLNIMEHITVDVGSGNPGAVAVDFKANNTGGMSHVKIMSSDPNRAGAIGFRDSDQGTVGPYSSNNVHIIGFDVGIQIYAQSRHWAVFRELVLEEQKVAGIEFKNVGIDVYNGEFRMNVPVAKSYKTFINDDEGFLNLINVNISSFDGSSMSESAIQLEGSFTYLRDVNLENFDSLISSYDTVLKTDSVVGEWKSHPRNFLWSETPDKSLNLPVEEFPVPVWPSDPSVWTVVPFTASNGDDETELLRAAFASGSTHIMLQPGVYRILDTIRIPPHIEYIYGNHAMIRGGRPGVGFPSDGRPFFEVVSNDNDLLTLEAIRGEYDTTVNRNPFLLNSATSNLFLKRIHWICGPAYRGHPSATKVFVDDFHTLPGNHTPLREDFESWNIQNQEVYVFQLNPEGLYPHTIVDGGTLWTFGFKFGEIRGPVSIVKNHGYFEALGGVLNAPDGNLDIDIQDTVMLEIENANASINFSENTRASVAWGQHETVVRETRGDETRELKNTDASVIHKKIVNTGAAIPLYTGYFIQDDPANVAPEILSIEGGPDSSGYEYSFTATVNDPDNYPAPSTRTLWRKLSGEGKVSFATTEGSENTLTFEREGTYQIGVAASDGALRTEEVITLEVRPLDYSVDLGRQSIYRYVDNHPADGVVNLFHPALMLVGDDVSNNISELSCQLPLNNLKTSLESIRSAKLRFLLSSDSTIDQVNVYRQTESVFGVMDALDFERPRELVGSIDLSGKVQGEWVSVDITNVLKDTLQEDADWMGIWLEGEGTSANGIAEQVVFVSTTSSNTSERPQFEVDMSGGPLQQNALSMGIDLWYSSYFGYFWNTESAWYYFMDLGWAYVQENDVSHLILYHPTRGWLYTTEEIFPWVYNYETTSWEL